ncbi:MAG: 4'-phosphopantetheinyl transferase superfamily protein [Bacteroidota bacterium]
MQGIGNDIIALSSIDVSRTQKPGFYSKILAQSEQQLYHDSFSYIPFEYFVWLLWSVKESAYKCLQRQQPALVFSPVNTVITAIELPTGTPPVFSEQIESEGFNNDYSFIINVTFHTQTLYARSIIFGDEVIHTVASFNPVFDPIHWGVKRIEETEPESQSSEVRRFLLAKYQTIIPGRELKVGKSASGYPFISLDGQDTGTEVSLSHHGEWVGYAMAL